MSESVVRAFCRGSAGSTPADKAAELTCDGCSIKFNVFKRKKQCEVCERFYCSQCLSPQNEPTYNTPASVLARFTDRKHKCLKCKVLTARPLCRSHLQQLRSKDLQFYLTSQNVSTRGCVEKDDLVNLLIRHVSNSSSSRSSRSGATDEFCSQDNIPGHQPFPVPPSGTSSFQSQGNISGNGQHSHRETSSLHSQTANSETSQYPHMETNGVHNQDTNSGTGWDPHQEMPGVHNEAVNSETRGPSHPEISGIHNDTNRPGTHPTSEIGSVSPTQGASSGQFESWVLLDVEDEPVVSSRPQQVEVDIVELTDWPMEDVTSEEDPVPVVTEIEEEGPFQTQDEEEVVQVEELETSKQVCSGITLASITSEADLENLTVKQLKELLILNRVDFRGCCEKAELKERVTRLWFENVQSRKELENLTMDELCKICMDAPVECVMLECGHMATCTACGKQLSECPICRQYVVRVVRTFKA